MFSNGCIANIYLDKTANIEKISFDKVQWPAVTLSVCSLNWLIEPTQRAKLFIHPLWLQYLVGKLLDYVTDVAFSQKLLIVTYLESRVTIVSFGKDPETVEGLSQVTNSHFFCWLVCKKSLICENRLWPSYGRTPFSYVTSPHAFQRYKGTAKCGVLVVPGNCVEQLTCNTWSCIWRRHFFTRL